jgi:hypothetical protein
VSEDGFRLAKPSTFSGTPRPRQLASDEMKWYGSLAVMQRYTATCPGASLEYNRNGPCVYVLLSPGRPSQNAEAPPKLRRARPCQGRGRDDECGGSSRCAQFQPPVTDETIAF